MDSPSAAGSQLAAALAAAGESNTSASLELSGSGGKAMNLKPEALVPLKPVAELPEADSGAEPEAAELTSDPEQVHVEEGESLPPLPVHSHAGSERLLPGRSYM